MLINSFTGKSTNDFIVKSALIISTPLSFKTITPIMEEMSFLILPFIVIVFTKSHSKKTLETFIIPFIHEKNMLLKKTTSLKSPILQELNLGDAEANKCVLPNNTGCVIGFVSLQLFA